MNPNTKIAFAEITTWQGISIGADHYYLHISWYDKNDQYNREEIYDILTGEHAKILNKRERNKAPDFRYKYKKGHKISGFWTRELAEKAAIQWVEENIPEYKIILTGSTCSASVSRCIKHPDIKIMNKLNSLYKKAKDMGFYNNQANEKKMEKIDDEFNRLIHMTK